MQCTHKVLAVIPGKFREPPGSLFVPCGKCLMCRIAKSREWGLRCIHEMEYHDDSVFATLTFNPAHLPWKMDLNKKTLSNYIKRLRKHVEPRKIRYLAAGEYGDIRNIPDGSDPWKPQDPDYWTYFARGFGRPHYHLIIFGLSLMEHKLELLTPGHPEKGYKCTGGPIYDCWTDPHSNYSRGFVVLGAVTYNSARYCVEYIFKQVDKISARPKYRDLQQPFKLQSQGLGKQWAIDNQEQLCYNMSLSFKGHELALPRYYQKKLITTEERREQFHEKARQADLARREIWRKKGVPEEEIEKRIQESRTQKERDVRARIKNSELQKGKPI